MEFEVYQQPKICVDYVLGSYTLLLWSKNESKDIEACMELVL